MKKNVMPYSLVSPAMIVTIGIIFIPMIRTITYSFTNYVLFKPNERHFSGLANYIEIFKDPIFRSSLAHTLIWIAGIILFQFLLGFATALLLNQNFFGKGIARSLILIPWVTPSVITSLMWRWMYDGNYGVINQILYKLNLIDEFVPWLANASTALGGVMLALVWQGFPFFAIMILAGLQSIPEELYEAASIDGASTFQKFSNITIPMVAPITLTTVLLRIIWVANSLDVILVMTGGGPGYRTYTLPVYSYIKAYKGMDFGYSSALSVLLTILLMGIIAGYVRKLLKKDEA